MSTSPATLPEAARAGPWQSEEADEFPYGRALPAFPGGAVVLVLEAASAEVLRLAGAQLMGRLADGEREP